jgi:tetratricopeptide (TPR) repeat protein
MKLTRILVVAITSTAAFALTPAESKIEAAKRVLAKSGANAESVTDLAWAYIKRARETSDVQYYVLAQAAITNVLKLSPDDFEARKAECAILVAKGEYTKGLELARNLNKRIPDDVLVYGFIADTEMALGHIDAAENAAQWMLDLRPANVPGMLRGAELRRIFKDPDGAIDWLNQAYRRVQPEETEERAYILTRISEVYISKGDVKNAARAAEQSLKVFPAYPKGLQQVERVKAATQASAGAVTSSDPSTGKSPSTE